MKSEERFSISKPDLRKKVKADRKAIDKTLKNDFNKRIFKSLIEQPFFEKAKTILIYASTEDEVETDNIISYALSLSKRVATPRCEDLDGRMCFYYINSLDDLFNGAYGIREPKDNVENLVDNFDDALIILPGLAFDKEGNRLGYGKGYYDRFLQIHPLNSVGLCYNSFIVDKVPCDKYDKKVDYIVTDSRMIACENGGKNGKY